MVTPMMQCSTLSCGRSTAHYHRPATHPGDINASVSSDHLSPHQSTDSYLEEARDVGDDVPEDVLILLTVKPAELGDPGVQLDQRLGHKRRQLWPCGQIVEHIVPCWTHGWKYGCNDYSDNRISLIYSRKTGYESL